MFKSSSVHSIRIRLAFAHVRWQAIGREAIGDTHADESHMGTALKRRFSAGAERIR